MYSGGLTVLPVCPTCSPWSRQPASTTARLAPTAALPNAAARSSSSLKFAGSLRPRPPEITTVASVTSSTAASGFLTPLDGTRRKGRHREGATVPALPLDTGWNVFGRIETTAVLPGELAVLQDLAGVDRPNHRHHIALDTKRGDVGGAGDAKRAATRGARSRPIAVAAKTMAPYPAPIDAIVADAPSGE